MLQVSAGRESCELSELISYRIDLPAVISSRESVDDISSAIRALFPPCPPYLSAIRVRSARSDPFGRKEGRKDRRRGTSSLVCD